MVELKNVPYGKPVLSVSREEASVALDELADTLWLGKEWASKDTLVGRGGTGDSPGYAWHFSHRVVEIEGSFYDLKVPTFKRRLEIDWLRPVGERFFNDSFLVYRSTEGIFRDETALGEHLTERGIKVFTPRPDLSSDSFLVTEYVPGTNLIDLLGLCDASGQEALLCTAARVLKDGHEALRGTGRSAFGDAWMGSFYLVDSTPHSEMLFSGFGFLPNPAMPPDRAIAKDLLCFSLSSIERCDAAEPENQDRRHTIAEAILNAYQPSPGVLVALEEDLQRDIRVLERHPRRSFLERKFFANRVFGEAYASHETFLAAKKSLYQTIISAR